MNIFGKKQFKLHLYLKEVNILDISNLEYIFI